MAPINADVAEVAAQLSAIRLRRNGLAAQRALAGALSAALIAAAMVVAAALRGSATVFAIAAVIAGIATLAAAGVATWQARREWLSLPATARLADTCGQLDERLTTLLAVAPLAPPPALRALLVTQVLGARHRWDLAALAPRRISPWLALVPLAILVFVATAFYARPPATARMHPQHGSPRPLEAKALAGAPVIDRSATGDDPLTQGDTTLAMASGTRDRAGRGGAERSGSGTGNAADTSLASDGATATGAADGAIDGGAPAADNRLADLRPSIREAFGAPPDTDLGTSPGAGHEQDHSAPANARAAGGAKDSAGDNSAAGDDGANSARGAGKDKPGDSTAAGTQAATPGAATNRDGAHGSGRGGAGGTGEQGVLGAAGSPQVDANPAAPMAIKLAAISGVSSSQSEPQRRSQGVATRAAAASRTTPNLPDLANEQLADVTMQQLDVGPEHEAIVRRLFTRE